MGSPLLCCLHPSFCQLLSMPCTKGGLLSATRVEMPHPIACLFVNTPISAPQSVLTTWNPRQDPFSGMGPGGLRQRQATSQGESRHGAASRRPGWRRQVHLSPVASWLSSTRTHFAGGGRFSWQPDQWHRHTTSRHVYNVDNNWRRPQNLAIDHLRLRVQHLHKKTRHSEVVTESTS